MDSQDGRTSRVYRGCINKKKSGRGREVREKRKEGVNNVKQ